jgi:2-haloacid dehalogenase
MATKLHGIGACVFDAYGTLFDVNSAARNAEEWLGDQWQPLAELWRAKQLQYTWLRSLTGHHVDFWQVTGDALDFALSTMQIQEPALRSRLMDLYMVLGA